MVLKKRVQRITSTRIQMPCPFFATDNAEGAATTLSKKCENKQPAKKILPTRKCSWASCFFHLHTEIQMALLSGQHLKLILASVASVTAQRDRMQLGHARD